MLRPIMSVYVAQSYYEGWQFSPFLIMGEVFSSLVTFLGTFYMVEKKNATVPVAIAMGAVSNILLNLLLVPRFGPLAAAFTTFVSYVISFGVRAVDVHRVVPIRMRLGRCGLNLALLLGQLGLMFLPKTSGFLFQVGAFCVIALFNFGPALRMLKALLTRFGLVKERRQA
jgi:O-antigen/teichoic acid export membrane protein